MIEIEDTKIDCAIRAINRFNYLGIKSISYI